MLKMEVKSLNEPDETTNFDKGKLELVQIGGARIARTVLQPEWRWSTSVRPIAKTKSCEAPHFQYHVSGTLHIIMDDGTEKDLKAGEVSLVLPGHDKWVVGNEPVIAVDFQGVVDYSKEPSERFGWRVIQLLIQTNGGRTEAVGKELLERKEVTFVGRTIGQYTIDLRAEVFVQSSGELLNLIEEVKAISGVTDVIWSEIVEVVGRKNPPYL
ncbi:MAG TPA: cupin domain-containing protein [Nitrososphaerales archaeon]|nr:cupin domain-containing protein [Nitrososphaerales archaeon]